MPIMYNSEFSVLYNNNIIILILLLPRQCPVSGPSWPQTVLLDLCGVKTTGPVHLTLLSCLPTHAFIDHLNFQQMEIVIQ